MTALATPLPRIVVLATGGTIAGRAGSTLSHEYKAGSATGTELVQAVPELATVADIDVQQVCNIASSNMSFAIWRDLAGRIDALFSGDPGLAGIVVTHGTNTLEETAYFLNLVVDHDRPVVLVGSQRPATALSSDGPLNLVNAVRVAACPGSRGRGVLVVLNDQVNAARDVTKTNTYRVETFRSGDLGMLGYADADRVAWYRRPEQRHTVHSEFAAAKLGTAASWPKVEIVHGFVESDARTVVEALVAAGTRGFVFTGTGAALLSDVEKEIVQSCRAHDPGLAFVRASRLGNGRVLAHQEHDALGIIPADNLSPQKARILLMLALAAGSSLADLQRMFAEY